MAYKFQLGAAVLSGSLTQEGNILAKDSRVSGSTIAITNVSGLVESGGGLADSGDGTLELSMDGMDSVAFDVAQDKIFFSAVGNAAGNIRSGSLANLATGMAGTALNASSGQLSVSGVANAQIDNNAAISLTKLAAVTAGRVVMGNASNQATATAISGDISLANNGAVSLAGAQTNVTSILNAGFQAIGTAADQEAIDFTQANEVSINVNGTSMLTVTSTAVEIAGNLTVEGTTTTIESNTLLVKDKTIELNVVTGSEGRASNSGAGLFISGSTEANDASLVLTADGGRFKASGSAAGFDVQSGGDYRINGVSILSSTALASSVLVDGDSLRINNCASSLNAAGLADADLFIVDDGAAGDPKKITAGNLKTFFQEGVSATSTNGFSLNTYNTASTAQSLGGNTGVWISNDPGGASDNAVTLHLSGAWSNGNVVIVKAPSNAATNNLTIFASGSQLIDGESSIVLESNFGAVSLVYGDNDNWFIF